MPISGLRRFPPRSVARRHQAPGEMIPAWSPENQNEAVQAAEANLLGVFSCHVTMSRKGATSPRPKVSVASQHGQPDRDEIFGNRSSRA
mgnify:CR=1 FL=1